MSPRQIFAVIALLASTSLANSAIVYSLQPTEAATKSTPSSGNGVSQYRFDTNTGIVQLDSDGGNNSFVDTDKGSGDWILNGLNYWQSVNGEMLQLLSGFATAPNNDLGRIRSNILFMVDGGATTGTQSIGIDVFLNDANQTDSNGPLALWIQAFAWNDGDTAPALATNGGAPGSYNSSVLGDAVNLLDKTVSVRSGITDSILISNGTWTTVDLGDINLGVDGYDYYAWRIGARGYNRAGGNDNFSFRNITAVPEPGPSILMAMIGSAALLRRNRR